MRRDGPRTASFEGENQERHVVSGVICAGFPGLEAYEAFMSSFWTGTSARLDEFLC
jgi:hypothetical protein